MLYSSGSICVFGAGYIDTKVGATSLTPTVSIYRILHSSLTASLIIDGATASEVGLGLYVYAYTPTSNSPATYFSVFHTTDTTVDQQDLFGVAIGAMTWVDNVDAAITSRAATGAAMTLAASSVNAAAVTNAAASHIAEVHLKYDNSAITGEADRSPLNALRFLRNKVSVSGTTLTVTKENDSTTAWTGTVTTDGGAAPITGVDPA